MKKLKEIILTKEDTKDVPAIVLSNIKSNTDRLMVLLMDKLGDSMLADWEKLEKESDTTMTQDCKLMWTVVTGKVAKDIIDAFEYDELKENFPDDEERLVQALTLIGFNAIMNFDSEDEISKVYTHQVCAAHTVLSRLESRTGLHIPPVED